ncbi:MAG: hypothetical protein JSU86_02265 [Phycisphaerales bacterium]|nr:MAG: hypothetical protein JSU86_02265 [Phycisphaerales bacterium]
MNARRMLWVPALVALVPVVTATGQTPMGTAFTYQGQLTDNDDPADGQYDFEFKLCDDPVAACTLATTTVEDEQVDEGLFTVEVDFGAGVFNGEARWLELGVRPGASSGADPYTTLSPRQELTPTPHAFRAQTGVGGPDALNVTTDDKVGIGTDSPAEELDVAGDVHASGTIASGSSITIDGTPGSEKITSSNDLDLHVSSGRVLRVEAEATSPNLIGGYSGNSVTSGVKGATIGGGGEAGLINRVTDDYGTIGGGMNNQAGDNTGTTDYAYYATVSGGRENTASNPYATVAGGYKNNASDYNATISGGGHNTASGFHSTIGGGRLNLASVMDSTVGGGAANEARTYYATVGGGIENSARGEASTIGGGQQNIAAGAHTTVSGGSQNVANSSGIYSTVPGGRANQAGGEYSFAAGNRAKVRNSGDSGDPDGDEGTFIWADSTDEDFQSSGPNQFLIRASGGVGIGTDSPAEQLDVEGNIHASGTITSGSSITIDGTADIINSTGNLDLQTGGTSRAYVDGGTGRVGIGTTSPVGGAALHVSGGSVAQWNEGPTVGYGKTSVYTDSGILDLSGDFTVSIPSSLYTPWLADNYIFKVEVFVSINPTSDYPHTIKGSAYSMALIGKQRGTGLVHFHEKITQANDVAVTFTYSSPVSGYLQIDVNTSVPDVGGIPYRVTVKTSH